MSWEFSGFPIPIPFRSDCWICSSSPRTTKRSVLSQAAQIFDPLGWLAPVTVWTKIFIQTLWSLTTDWDEPLVEKSENEWREFMTSLPALRRIQIPRCMGLTSTSQSVDVHGFSDASERAYSAVAYLRVQDASGDVQIHLISAKTKVAPLKQQSLPRLELSGASSVYAGIQHRWRAFVDGRFGGLGLDPSPVQPVANLCGQPCS